MDLCFFDKISRTLAANELFAWRNRVIRPRFRRGETDSKEGYKMRQFPVLLLFIGFAAAAMGHAAPADSCQAGKVKMTDGKDMVFRLYVPHNIVSGKKYPLVMNLHGIGECGSDNKAQVNN